MKLTKLVKNGARIFYLFAPIFGQITYFRGIKVTIWAKNIKKCDKNSILAIHCQVHKSDSEYQSIRSPTLQ